MRRCETKMRLPILVLVIIFLCEQSAALPECIIDDFDKVPAAVRNCTTLVLNNFDVPGGETLNLQLQDGATLYFRGTITFGYAEWAGPLVMINGTNVHIEGEGQDATLNGQGELYWDGHGETGVLKPKFFTIQLHNSSMVNINVKNSPVHMALITDSTDSVFSEWVMDDSDGDVIAPNNKTSGHNTDGFDIFNSTNILLRNNVVYNQDDCVAIRSGANIVVDEMVCTGGHGLSISVGFSKDDVKLNTLENVTVSNSVVRRSANGIHIKTHVDGGQGIIRNVTYMNIILQDISGYGVSIQENYINPSNGSHIEPTNNIPIYDLKLENFEGSILDKARPYYINCAEDGCFNWSFTGQSIAGGSNSSCNYHPDDFVC